MKVDGTKAKAIKKDFINPPYLTVERAIVPGARQKFGSTFRPHESEYDR